MMIAFVNGSHTEFYEIDFNRCIHHPKNDKIYIKPDHRMFHPIQQSSLSQLIALEELTKNIN